MYLAAAAVVFCGPPQSSSSFSTRYALFSTTSLINLRAAANLGVFLTCAMHAVATVVYNSYRSGEKVSPRCRRCFVLAVIGKPSEPWVEEQEGLYRLAASSEDGLRRHFAFLIFFLHRDQLLDDLSVEEPAAEGGFDGEDLVFLVALARKLGHFVFRGDSQVPVLDHPVTRFRKVCYLS